MKIGLHIERLVLDGFELAPAERDILQASVLAELSRLLGEAGLQHELARGGSVPRVSGSEVQLANGSPAQLGQQIARSIHGGIGRE